MSRRHILLGLVLLLVCPALAGCGALFGQRLDNFRAYYNTFYNAERDLERVEREIYRANEPVERARFLSVFPMRPQGGRTGDQAFENAIRRAADVVRDHPHSRWVDDALLLIGKAYFYQGNYDAAAQKFREVLLLEESRTREEARLWLGRSLMEARSYGDAAAELRQALSQNDLRPAWSARMRLVLGEVELRRGDLEEATAELRRGLDGLDDPELGARAAFLLGQVLDARGEFDAAAEAYARSLDLRPYPELVYAAGLQRALALSRTGRTDEALARLERMRRDDRYFQQRAEVELARARVLAEAREPEAARDLLLQVLYTPDSGMRVDRVRGHLHYRLGEVYRDGLDDFPRAAAHFDTAATVMRQSVAALREVQTTREAVLDVQRQADSFGGFALVFERVVEMDSLLYLGSLDDDAFTREIERIAEMRRQELMEAERERRRLADQQDFGGAPMAGGIPGAAPNGGEATTPGEAGFLSYRNPARVQENLMSFQSRWGDRPLVPNWRRRDAVSTVATAGRPGANGEALPVTPTTADVSYTALVDVSAIPRDPVAFETMRHDRAIARYELGNVLFLTLGDPGRAEYWYQKVIEEDADFPIVTRARYALAELYAEAGREDEAEALLATVGDLPDDDPLGRAARDRLGRPNPEPPPDTLQLAEARYAIAFESWQAGDHAHALTEMLAIDGEVPATDLAARARLAAGMIYVDWAAADTLALIAAEPTLLIGDGSFGRDVASEAPPQAPFLLTLGDPAAPSETTLPDSDEAPVDADAIDADLEADPEPRPSDAAVVGEPRPDGDASQLEVLGQAGTDAHRPLPAPGSPEPGVPTGSPAADSPERDPPSHVEGDQDVTRAWLEELFASIEEDFPGTRFAERAARLREVIEEHRLIVEARELEEEEQRLAGLQEPIGGDFLLPDELTGRTPIDDGDDTPGIPDDEFYPEQEEPPPGEPDRTGQGDEETLPGLITITDLPDAEPGDFDEAFLHGTSPIIPEIGGFSWAVVSTPRSFEAQNRLVAFHNAGYRTALLQVAGGGRTTFIVLIGQFPTAAEAAAAMDSLPEGRSPDQVELVVIDPHFELQTPDDLLSR